MFKKFDQDEKIIEIQTILNILLYIIIEKRRTEKHATKSLLRGRKARP